MVKPEQYPANYRNIAQLLNKVGGVSEKKQDYILDGNDVCRIIYKSIK